MLKLVYNVKCGFKELFITEKNLEEDLTNWIEIFNDGMLECVDEIRKDDPDYEPIPYTEEELYEQYKDDPETLIFDVFNGITDFIYEATTLEYAKTYFKHICYKDLENPFIPGYFEMTNLQLVLEDEPLKKYVEHSNESLKAKEVMALLKISRPTLCHYVKKGLIKIDTNYTGKQYRYNKESVLNLMKGSK